MSRIDLPPQPNGYKVQWSYLPKQFSAENIEEILDLFRKFVPTGDFTLGKPVREFEEKFAAMIGTRQAIGVNSGTDAIKLGLKALGVGPGDEVITTANTFIATVGAIGELFARPVFVDCTDNFCMDVSQVEARITKKTKAIVPVHLAGQMTNMPALMEIAQQAQPAGGRGFLPVHPRQHRRQERRHLRPLRRLFAASAEEPERLVGRRHDRDRRRRFRHRAAPAAQSRPRRPRQRGPHGLQFAARFDPGGGRQLADRPGRFHHRHADQERRLSSTAGSAAFPASSCRSASTTANWCSTSTSCSPSAATSWSPIARSKGIEVKVHYPVPLYQQEGLRQYGYKKGDFPVTDRHAATMISFPAHEHLTEEQLAYTVQTVEEFYGV